MPRRPLIGLVVGFILGTVLGFRVPLPWGVPFAFAVFAWSLAAIGLRWVGSRDASHVTAFCSRGPATAGKPVCRALSTPGVTGAALVVAMLGMGWTRVALEPGRGAGDAWRGPAEGRVTVTGIVAADPDDIPLSRARRICYRFPLRVTALDGAEFGPAEPMRVNVSWYDFVDARPPIYGECWSGRAKIKTEPYRGRVYLEIDGRDARTVSGGHGWAAAAWCYRTRREAARYLTLGIEDYPEITGLLRALLLGYRRALPFEARRVFVATGTLHIFAISGLHIGIITLLGMTVLKAMRVPRQAWVFVLGPLLGAYALGTGARASAVRASLIAVAYVAAPAFGRRPDGLSSLALAALVILAAVPSQVMDAGFVLSFVVVLGLMILYPRFERLWRPWVEPDPLRIVPEVRWRVKGRRVCVYILSLLTLSACAWISSAPLAAYYFERFTPIALLANVWVVPLTYMIVLTGGLVLVLGPIADVLAIIFNHANLALMGALVGGMRLLSRVPLSCCEVPVPPIWAICLWYAALAALVMAYDHRRQGT